MEEVNRSHAAQNSRVVGVLKCDGAEPNRPGVVSCNGVKVAFPDK